MSQTEASHTIIAPGIVRRTDRGLCLAGRRVTLYLIMDYLKAGWPPHLIRHWLDLSEAEMHHAVQYIEIYCTAFEAEYAKVVQQAQAREQDWAYASSSASQRCWSVISHLNRPQRGHGSRRSSVRGSFDDRPARS